MCRVTLQFTAMLAVGQMLGLAAVAAKEPLMRNALQTATPLGDPSGWITSDDYPPLALDETRGGTVHFRLNVNAAGTVADCTVIISSGSADLDLATCDLVTRRARFKSTRDGRGYPQPGTYSDSVHWTIPQSPPPQPSRVVTRYIVETDGTMSNCEVTQIEGVSKLLPTLGKFPCRPGAFSEGYVDGAGRNVRRQVTVTQLITVGDVPKSSLTN